MWVLATYDEDGKSWAMNLDQATLVIDKGMNGLHFVMSNYPNSPIHTLQTKASPASVISLLMSAQAAGLKFVRFHEGVLYPPWDNSSTENLLEAVRSEVIEEQAKET